MYCWVENFFGSQKGYYTCLALVSLCFVAIKIAMPIIYDGSFIDEYFHSVAGTHWFEHKSFPTFRVDEAPYNRGSYVSLLSGLLNHFFGKSVFSFKLVPIAVGTLNFFLLMFLAHKTLARKSYVLLLLIIYSISPWVLFNHFYLRMYVFYELFLLLNLIIAERLLTFCKRNRKWYLLGGILVLSCLCFAQIKLSNDDGVYMPVLAAGIALAYIFIACSQQLQFRNKILNDLFTLNAFFKLAIIIISAVILYFLFNGEKKLLFLFNGNIEWTSAAEFKYSHFFFKKNYIITLFFLLSGISSLFFESKRKQMLSLVGIIMFSLHIASSLDLQITRGIFYFMPLYYLVSLISLTEIRYFSDKIFLVTLSFFIFFTTIKDYPPYFLKMPYVPSEIHYIDYDRVYSSVQKHCSDKVIVEASPSPFIASFHNVKVDYVLSETGWISKDNGYYYNDRERRFKTVFQDTPVVSDLRTVSKKDHGICLIVRKPSQRQHVYERTLRSLAQKRLPLRFANIELYINP